MSKQAVILVGGKGTRLRPYTLTFPKPMMPVGEMPILEVILRQLAANGFSRVILAVNHQAAMFRTYFGDGAGYGLEIVYSLELEPLGTMGPLRLIEHLPEHFLVMNGDILTDLDYAAALGAHAEGDELFTVFASQRTQLIDYGVLGTDDGGGLISFAEKPRIPYLVSMGVYAVSLRVLEHIPPGVPFGFDQLMHALLAAGQRVHVVPYEGYWLDIGRPDDYELANDDFERMRPRLLREPGSAA